MQQASPHSREYASMLGLTPCPECLPDEQADTTNADLSGSLGRQAEWMAIDLPSFDADSAITIHSASALRTTGCLYVEFEFTLNDEAIIPSSIQIALTDKEGTELPVLTTALVEPADADGETVYLLCETMAAPEDSFVFDGLTFYGSTDPEVREPLGPS